MSIEVQDTGVLRVWHLGWPVAILPLHRFGAPRRKGTAKESSAFGFEHNVQSKDLGGHQDSADPL